MFTGLAPWRIPETAYALGENLEIRYGRAETRRGSQVLEYAKTSDELIAAGTMRDVGGIAGNDILVGVIYRPDLLTPGLCYAYRYPCGRKWISLPGNIAKNDNVTFCQHNQYLYMTRGTGRMPWRWTGNMTDGFTDIPEPETGNRIPEAEYAVSAYNRLWVVYDHGRTLAASDLLSDTFDLVEHAWQLDPYLGGRIVGVFPFENGGMLAFLEGRVFLLHGANGDLSDMTAKVVDNDHGCVAAQTIVQVGADVWYLAHDGVRGVLLGEDNIGRAIDIPLSEPIKELWAEVNMGQLNRSFAIVHDNYYMLAVPSAGSTLPNMLFVFDLILKTWVGKWFGTDGALACAFLTEVATGKSRALLACDEMGGIHTIVAGLFQDQERGCNSVAMKLDGSVTYGGFTSDAAGVILGLQQRGGFAVQVKMENNGATLESVEFGVYTKSDYTTGDFRFWLHAEGDSTTIRAELPASPGWLLEVDSGVLPSIWDDQWHTVAMLADGTNPVELLIDGKVYGTTATAEWIADTFYVQNSVVVGEPFFAPNPVAGSLLVRNFTLLTYTHGGWKNAVIFPLDEGTSAAGVRAFDNIATPPTTIAGVLTADTAWDVATREPTAIPFRLVSRGLTFGAPGNDKAIRAVELTVAHRSPRLTVEAKTEDPFVDEVLCDGKEYVLGDSEIHGVADWDGLDLATYNLPGRADYSPLTWPATATVPTAGIDLDAEAEHTVLLVPSLRGRSFQLDIRNAATAGGTSGTLAVEALAANAVLLTAPSKPRR